MSRFRALAGRHAPAFVRRRATRGAAAAAEAELERVLAGPRPLVVGPWMSEVGFELEYWIPLLRCAFRRNGIPPSDVVVVSRGGTAPWYAGIADRYDELLDRVGAGAIAALRLRRRALTGSEKQSMALPEEREIVEGVARDLGLETYGWLHPRLMYRLFEHDWSFDRDLDDVFARTTHEPLPPPDEPLPVELPTEPFVAVKAYFSELALPQSASSRSALGVLLEGLADRAPLVLLQTPVAVDEHKELAFERALRLDGLEPSRNLSQQTAVVARAAGLVCTYGGFSYLGGYLGVPTLTLQASNAHNHFHLDVFRRALADLGSPPFVGPVDVAEARPELLPLR